MLAIKRIKDIRAGKRFNSVEMNRLHSQQVCAQLETPKKKQDDSTALFLMHAK